MSNDTTTMLQALQAAQQLIQHNQTNGNKVVSLYGLKTAVNQAHTVSTAIVQMVNDFDGDDDNLIDMLDLMQKMIGQIKDVADRGLVHGNLTKTEQHFARLVLRS